jgi:hypothetical protein
VLPVIPKEKERAYILFLTVMRAAVIHIAFALVALVSFAFGNVLSATLGFLTIAIGTFVVLIDLARRSHFVFSLAVLFIVALITAVNVT